MMESNYYYIISSLPELVFKETEDYSSYLELFDEVFEALSEDDQKIFQYIRYSIDNKNLVHLLKKEEGKFIDGGNYNLSGLKYELKALDTIPEYMQLFLEDRKRNEEVKHIKVDLLHSLFYFEVLGINHPFTRSWFGFERDLENVLTALECRKHNEPIERRETIRADQKPGQRLAGDYDVTHNILYNKALDYSLGGILPWMIRAMDFNSDNPLEYEQDIMYLKLEILSDYYDENAFSLDVILAWFIRLQLFIRWSNLNEEKGKLFYRDFLEKADKYLKETVLV